jgi:MFS family permease
MQMNSTMAVYLRDVHSIPEQGFGYILSLNAIMVVLFQFAITRRITRFPPLAIMTVGTLFYAVGFALYGFVSVYAYFLLAMVIITIGEMLVSPVSQSIVARLAPEAMRGRYMAVFGFSWLLPIAIGPTLSGLVMDYWDPHWVWYLAGIVGLAAAGAYYWLGWRVGRSRFEAIEARLRIVEQLEDGLITAEQASRQLEAVSEGVWTRLVPPDEAGRRRHLRIKVSDPASGTMKSDLRIPMGLVNALLHGEASLSSDLEQYSLEHLKEMIAKSTDGQPAQRMRHGEDEIEVSLE